MNPDKAMLNLLREGYRWCPVTIGESGAEVYRLVATNKPSLYLKVAPLNLSLELQKEAVILEWLQGQLPVPEVVAFFVEPGNEYLVTTELPGTNLAALIDDSPKPVLAKLLATSLRLIHTVSIEGCPVSCTLAQEMKSIQERVLTNRVDEANFDAPRKGRKASDLLTELQSKVPPAEDLVFTHGDYCFPNILAQADCTISGFVDVNRAGIGDRYRDIALAVRSIEEELGTEWVAVFLKEYGLPKLDYEKVAFYQLLDEFF